MTVLLDLLTGNRFVVFGRRLGAFLVFALCFGSAKAQLTYRDLHDFGGSIVNANGAAGPDGINPTSSVTFDASGNAFGTTPSGGPNGAGILWKISATGDYKDIHDFGGTVTNANGISGPDGAVPSSGVSFDSLGNMYGTTFGGGPNLADGGGAGMVWEITSAGVYKDLHDFGGMVLNAIGTSGPDGEAPIGGVALDSHGNMYGATTHGGPVQFSSGVGMVWEISSTGAYKDLHDFGGTVTNANGMKGPDGAQPMSGATCNSNGNVYGATQGGGAYFPNDGGAGIVWEITSGGTYVDVHDFGGTVTLSDGSTGTDGEEPVANVAFDSLGNMFGTAYGGGLNTEGIVWEMTSDGVYKDLHDFGGTITQSDGSSGRDGTEPESAVSFDGHGNIYGTTNSGARVVADTDGGGMVWEITVGGLYKDLHDFGGTVTNANGASGEDGIESASSVYIDAAGNLYGSARYGGPDGETSSTLGDGMIWALRLPERVMGLTLNPSTIGGLGTTTGTIALTGPAPSGGWPVTVHAGASGYLNMPSSVTVPAGASSATFTITGTAQRVSTINMGIFATDSVGTVETILAIQGDSIKSFTLSPSQIKWTSGTATATLTIASAAPPGGWIVTLQPGVGGYVNMPTSVTVPAGSTSTTCSITGSALRFFTLDLGITASDGGSKATTTLVIAGDAVKSLSLSPSTIGWSGASTATVNLVVAAPPGGWVVNTNPGSSGYVTMPGSITVPAGATSATFTIKAGSQRSLNLSLGIYANDGPSNQSAVLKIEGDSVKSLTLSPSTITALGKSTATVTLASAAPPGGWVLTLHPGASGYVSMPTTLTVPTGATTATFTITGIIEHSSTIDLGIFVSDGNSTQEAILTIT